MNYPPRRLVALYADLDDFKDLCQRLTSLEESLRRQTDSLARSMRDREKRKMRLKKLNGQPPC